MRIGFFAVILLFAFTSFRSEPESQLNLLQEYCSLRYPKQKFNDFLFVRIRQQKLFLLSDWKVKAVYDVSTSSKGVGFEKDSEKTPWGLHRIIHRLGQGVPENGILNGSQYSGQKATIEERAISTGKDDVTSRALRLEGLEKGLNKGGKNDTFIRNIYIHGTPEEGLIGQPASHGCVRMRNKDIIELFTNTKTHMLVLLLDN